MNTNQELALMNAAETTALKISQSTKIAKQVMRSKLVKALKLNDEKRGILLTAVKELSDEWSPTVKAYLNRYALSSLEECPKVAGVLDFVNHFSSSHKDKGPSEVPLQVSDLVFEICLRHPLFAICGAHGLRESKTAYAVLREIIETKEVSIAVQFQFKFNRNVEKQLDYRTVAPLSEDILGIAKKRLELLLEYSEVDKAFEDIELKILGIEKVAEEMEANLLVREMQKSQEGREVLDLTNELLTEYLNESPPLLGKVFP